MVHMARRSLLSGLSVVGALAPVARPAIARCDHSRRHLAIGVASLNLNTLDPIDAVPDDRVIISNVFAPGRRLVGPDGNVQAGLFENVSLARRGRDQHDTHFFLTIRIREERWARGDEVTANDVLGTLNRLAGKAGHQGKWPAQYFKNYVEAEVIDPRTVRILLSNDNITFLDEVLGTYLGSILHKDTPLRPGRIPSLPYNEGQDYTSGAYRIVNIIPENRIDLEASSAWRGPQAHFRTVSLHAIYEKQTRLLALKAGEICATSLPPELRHAGLPRHGAVYPVSVHRTQAGDATHVVPRSVTVYAALRADGGPGEDPGARRALRDILAAIRLPEDAVGTALLPSTGLVPANVPGALPRRLSGSSAGGADVLRRATLARPLTIRAVLPRLQAVREILISALRQQGIVVNPESPNPQSVADVAVDATIAFPFSARSPFLTVLQRMRPVSTAQVARHHLGWQNSSFETLVMAASQESSVDKLRSLVGEAEMTLFEAAVIVPLYNEAVIWRVDRDIRPSFSVYGEIGELAAWQPV